MKTIMIKLLSVVAVLAYAANCLAQTPPDIKWQQTFGGNGAEFFGKTIATSDGGFLVGGTAPTGISGNKEINGYGSGDSWIVKLDRNGNKQWENIYGSTNPLKRTVSSLGPSHR